MRFTHEEIESLVESNYQIECILIELTRQDGDILHRFAGPGSLRQTEDGCLRLKCYHTCDGDDELFQSWKTSIGNTLPGALIPEGEYFTMEAIDMEGHIWKAENVLLSGHFSIQVNAVIVESTVRQISSESERAAHVNHDKSSFYIVIPGNHSVPCNEWEDMGTKKTMSVCRINWPEFELTLKIRRKFLVAAFSGPSASLGTEDSYKIAEALSIVFGKICHIVLSTYYADQGCTSIISSVPINDSNKQIPSPIRHKDPWNYKTFETFLKCYLTSVAQPYGMYYEYWHRINRAWQGGIEIAALAVTTAIEGILKESFSDYIKPDEEFRHQAETAKEAVKSLDLDKRINDYLLSSLGNASKGSARNGLRYLKSKGLISEQLIKCWSELRNKAAHADSLEFDSDKLQEYIDLVFGCYHVFNILLLINIGYNGEYTNLSAKGWPAEVIEDDETTLPDQDA
jgi:hypothetical protein